MLPAMIEYLASIELTENNRNRRKLCRPVNAGIATNLLPNETISISAAPGTPYWGALYYATGMATLPQRIGLVAKQQDEIFYVTAFITEEQMLEPAGHLVFVTREKPVTITMSNLTGLNQSLDLTLYSLMTSTRADFERLQNEVALYNNPLTNELLMESNKLLAEIARKMK